MTTTLAGSTRPRHLVTRLLERPDLVHLVQGLNAPVLTRLIHHIGLEDAGEIVALATTEQLKGIFDEDLWRSERPGQDEAFDADRFALWLEVMLEAGEAFAAQKIAELDEDFVTLALGKHVLVIDVDALGVQMSSSERSDDDELVEKALESCLYQEFEEFRVIARDPRSWDPIVQVLVELDKEHHALLRSLLERCCAISSEHIEESGGLYEVLTSEEMLESDVAGEREDRREREGFVAPSAAASFLGLSRVTKVEEILGARAYDAVTRAHFRAASVKARPAAAAPRGSRGGEAEMESREAKGAGASEEVQSFLAMLREEEVLPAAPEPRLLTQGGQSGEELPFTVAIREVMAKDAGIYEKRLMELSYLVNILISGCSHDGGALRPFEAVEAAISTCNLGFERLLGERAGRKRPSAEELASVMAEHDAVKMFMAGFHTLHHEVVLFAAETLRKELAARIERHAADAQVAQELARISRGLEADAGAGKPWRSRGRLDRIEDVLGVEETATFRALLDELPTLPQRLAEGSQAEAGRRSRFIGSAAQVQAAQSLLKQAVKQPAAKREKGRARAVREGAALKPRSKRPEARAGRAKS